MLRNLQQMHLKLLQSKSFKKTAEATGDLIGNTIANKVTKLHNKIIRMSMIKKCLKNMYLQKKDKKILMN